jgi:hypothetical protein
MKNITIPLSIVFLLWSTFVIAQSRIEGQLVNPKTGPLPFASLILLNAADSSLVKGEISDANGVFRIENVQSGRYLLIGSLMGYKKSTLSKIELQSQQTLSLGSLVLEEVATELNEIVIQANKPVFEQRLDRLVMNISALPTMTGITGLELLQKTPGLIVNRQTGSISVLGKGEVLIMINNKVQRMPAEVLMARLQSMRAENIERIEVIHQPPAKYDASSAAGIIHIVLKENNMDGTNSSVALTGGYGQREKAGVSLNLNSRKGSRNWYGDYSYNLSKANQYLVNHFREYEYAGNQYYHENFVTLRNYSLGQHAINLGLDANIEDKTIIGFLLSGATSKQVWASNADSKSADYINEQFTGGTDYLFGTKTYMSSITANVNVFQKIGSGNDLSVNIDYAKIHYNNSGHVLAKNDPDHNILYDRSTPMQFWILSLDDVNRIGTKWTMETGIKGTFNNTVSNTRVESNEDDYWDSSNLFGSKKTIQEHIYAAYFSFKGDLSKKLNAEFGMRYEHYNYLLQSVNQNDFNKAFKNPFPIFRLNYKIDSVNTIQFGFNRSITRPSFNSLTSFLIIFDPSLTVYANPQLRPTFTNAIKLSWQHRSVIWSLGYLDRKDQIYFYNTVDKENDLQTSKPTNLDNEDIIETSLTFPLNPFRWWETNWNLNAFYHDVKDASSHVIKFEQHIFTYAIQVNSTFLLNKGWSIGMDGMYRSHYLDGDQQKYNRPYLNLGVRKKFSSGSSLSIAAQDITNSGGKLDWRYHQPELGIKTYGHNDFSERQVRVTYTLLFGNQKLKEKRERQTGSDDVKNRM